jgi:hypothetical protein
MSISTLLHHVEDNSNVHLHQEETTPTQEHSTVLEANMLSFQSSQTAAKALTG